MGVAINATPPPLGLRSSTLLPALVLILVAFVAWWASAPYMVGVFRDDGIYALLAKSIATGHGFHYLGLPGEPAATHQPPLYPLLLAAAWRLAPSFPDNISVLLAVNAVLLGVAALGLYHFAVARLGWRSDAAALGAAMATLISPMLTLSSALLSEPLFLAALWPALLVVERAASNVNGRQVAIAGASIGALMLVRTHAIALLAALAVVLACRRRPMHAALAAGVAILVLLPWQLWTRQATPSVPIPLEGAYGSYFGWYLAGLREGGGPFLLATARVNLREFWLLLMDRVAVGSLAWVQLAAAITLAALIAVGAWSTAKRSPVSVCFLACFLGIVLVWPYIPWRFVWAVAPMLLLLAAEGARRLVTAPKTGWRRTVALAVVALPATAMLGTEWKAYAGRTWLAPGKQASDQITPVVRWVATYTRPDDVVLTEGAEVVTLFTGRRAAPAASFTAREYLVPPDSASARAQLRAMLDAVPARYMFALLPSTQRAARSLSTTRAGLRELGTLPQAQAVVFEVIP